MSESERPATGTGPMMTAHAPQHEPHHSSSSHDQQQQNPQQYQPPLRPPRAPFLPRYHSGLSYGSALEADDELSNTSGSGLSDDETGSNTNNTMSTHRRTGSVGTLARYPGEDTRRQCILIRDCFNINSDRAILTFLNGQRRV